MTNSTNKIGDLTVAQLERELRLAEQAAGSNSPAAQVFRRVLAEKQVAARPRENLARTFPTAGEIKLAVQGAIFAENQRRLKGLPPGAPDPLPLRWWVDIERFFSCVTLDGLLADMLDGRRCLTLTPQGIHLGRLVSAEESERAAGPTVIGIDVCGLIVLLQKRLRESAGGGA